jgi:glycosyltransferase involved in cell wall biosynthesis
MRIAYLTSLFMPFLGGAEIFLHHLAKDMTARGHHAVVVSPGSKKHRHAFEMTYPHVRALRARSKRFLVGIALPSLLAAHKMHRFDLVHCQGEYHETTAACLFKKITGVPFVCRPIGGGFTVVEENPKLQKKLGKALSQVELVFAQGDFLRQRILDYGIPDGKIVTIRNGVRINEVRQYKTHRPIIEPPYLLYVGGLKQVKGFDIALDAFGKVASRFPDVKIVLTGIDQKFEEFQALSSKLKLGDRIRYLNYCDRPTMMNLFCHAEIYLCPFHRSPFSNANLEALAAGTPIVATAVEGNLEQIRDGEHGFLIPPGDAGAMAEKIAQILSDPILHRQMKEKAVIRSADFAWPEMVKKYEACYDRVMSRNTR